MVRRDEALKLRFAPAFDAYSYAVLVATIFNGPCTIAVTQHGVEVSVGVL